MVICRVSPVFCDSYNYNRLVQIKALMFACSVRFVVYLLNVYVDTYVAL